MGSAVPKEISHLSLVLYAIIPPEMRATYPDYAVTHGPKPRAASALAIKKNPDGSYTRMSFDSEWNCIEALPWPTLKEAKLDAEQDYRGLDKLWIEVKSKE
jgi:hypothetical protein